MSQVGVVSQVGGLPQAVLWDLDGTLVDTEPAWIVAESKLANRFGAQWNEADDLAMVGTALPHCAEYLRSKGVVGTDEAIIDHLIAEVLSTLSQGVPWQPGALEFLAVLRESGVRCALVTMSYRNMADQIIATAPSGVFEVVVAGDEVHNGKPHPEPYLTAASLLGVEISRCVAFEDSPTGMASAEAAGAAVVGIERHVKISAHPGRSRLLTLEGFSLADLGQVASGVVIDRIGSGNNGEDPVMVEGFQH